MQRNSCGTARRKALDKCLRKSYTICVVKNIWAYSSAGSASVSLLCPTELWAFKWGVCRLVAQPRHAPKYGPIAQLGERSVRIREVKGSNPSRSIKRRIVLNDTAFLFVLGSCFFNTAAHRDVIQASCYPITSKTNYTTIVFKKFCITTRTRQGRPKPFLEREGFGFFVFGGVPRRTTKASAAHGRAASAQAQCAADAYFLCRAPSPDGKVRASAAF